MSLLVQWLLTYLIHSTALLVLALVVERVWRAPPAFRELMWRVALVGGLLSATVQTTTHLRPLGGTFAWPTQTEAAEAPRESQMLTTIMTTQQGAASLVVIHPRGIEKTPRLLAIGEGTSMNVSRFGRGLALGWGLLSSALLLGLARSFWTLKKRLEGRRRLESTPLGDKLAELAAKEPVLVHAPLLSASSALTVPIALGLRHPEICVPDRVTTELDPEAQESVLAHELGHIVRNDILASLATDVFCRVFFFQPLNWLAGRRLAACAELNADDWAAKRTEKPLELASCLTQVARWISRPAFGIPVPAMAARKSELAQRVERLVRGESLSSESRRPRWAMPVLVSALVALTWLAPAAGGVAQAKDLPVAAPQTATARAPLARTKAAQRVTTKLVIAQDEEDGDDEVDPCEASKHQKKHARKHEDARREKEHDEDRADADDDNDDDVDDQEDAADDEGEEDEIAPPDLPIEPPAEPDEDDLERRISASIPSAKAIEKEIERAQKLAERAATTEAEQKEIRKEMKRARKDALRELNDGLRELHEQMRALQKELPRIREQAMEEARKAQREAEKAAKDAAKKHEDAAKKHRRPADEDIDNDDEP